MKGNTGFKDIQVGIVGLGLMGSSIITSLLAAGHTVKAITPLPDEKKIVLARIAGQLIQSEKCGLLVKPIEHYLSLLTISDDYRELNHCSLVVECVIEDIEIKETVLQKIVTSIGSDTVLASNTSAIPISVLQKVIAYPERFIGIHWAEPAFATRFLEIICGEQTSAQTADWVFEIARHWGKEPTLLRRDIRGFITNRLMYSVYREALSLVGSGQTSIEDADKAFRYDAGSWITLMGIFRRMDFMGLKDYPVIFNSLFPILNNTDEVPAIMQNLVDRSAGDARNHKRFYGYTAEETKNWDEAFASFNQDIYQFAAKYPSESMVKELG